MKFDKLNDAILSARQSSFMLEPEAPAGGTKIETQVGPFWRTDGYDDKVPLPQASAY
jgi:hypothetical protein